MRLPGVTLITGTLFALSAQTVGPQPDGSVLLRTGWRVRPEGIAVATGSMPMSAVLSRDGRYLLTLNAGAEPPSVSVIDLAKANEVSRTPVPDAWLGLTISRTGDRVYTGGGSRASVYEFAFTGGELKPSRVFPIVAENARGPEDFIGDVQLSPDGRLLYAADLYRDSVVVLNPQSGLVIGRFKTVRRPFRILFHPSGRSFYVSSWADGTVSQHETVNGNRLTTIRVAPHTTDMLWQAGEVEDHPDLKARLFVSAGSTNNVYVLGANEAGDLSRLETISVALTPTQPAGMTPAGLGISKDGSHLVVACSDANAFAWVDISGTRSRVTGFVPTGEYPTAAIGLPDGRVGTLSTQGVHLVNVMERGPDVLTRTVIAQSPYSDQKRDAPGLPPNGPLRHLIYVVNGTAASAVGSAAPNGEAFSREFARLTNFHTNGMSVEDGMNWVTGAISPAYTQLLRRSSQAARRLKSDYEWQEASNSPPAGYLWTNAAQAGISMQNFGFFVTNLAKPGPDGVQISDVHDPVLRSITDESFRGRDTAYPDTSRVQAYISSLREFEKAGSMPRLTLIRLGSNKLTPAAIADNDQALGQLVEAVSKSRFWPDSVIFIVPESPADPTGNSPAWAISPYVLRHAETNTFFNQTSVLRTIEMILGLHPMTTFDAASAPLFELFTDKTDTAPFSAVKRP